MNKKLFITFSFLEMWERFGFYGMRALLTLFLIKNYGFADQKAFAIYSIYGVLCYTVPVLGGFLADKIFGYKKLLFFGSSILCIGHAILSFVSSMEDMFYLGLACIAVGTGFFKGNVSNMFGEIYDHHNNSERDSGFRIFYIMFNGGAFVASIFCGVVAEIYGWEYGFGLAGVGVLIGFIMLILSSKLLTNYGNPPLRTKNCYVQYIKDIKANTDNNATDTELSIYRQNSSYIINKDIDKGKFTHLIYRVCSNVFLNQNVIGVICSIILISITTIMFSYVDISLKTMAVIATLVPLHLIYIIRNNTKNEKLGIYFLIIMLMFYTLMFALEMQLGSFINVFTDKHVERDIFGIKIPTASLQALNPLTVIIFGTLVNISLKKFTCNTLVVFGIGLLMSCLCFMTLYIGCLNFDYNFKINIIFLVVSMIFMSLSEVLMAPIILSLISYVTPKKIRGYMMGFAMLCIAYSNLLGVVIAKYMLQIDINNINDILLNSLITYKECFFSVGILFAIAYILYAILYRFLHKIYSSFAKNSL